MISLAAPNQRLLIVGRTGSGKTVAGFFHLSQTNIDEKPWFIIDFKGDENIAAIVGATYIKLGDRLPTKPGIYILRLRVDEQGALEQFLWSIYNQENCGLFVDEGYMIGSGSKFSPAFRAILTQGRSKNIGVIINSQRPVWLDVFCKSEANKIQMFHLNFLADRKAMGEAMGDETGPDIHERLAPYHSIYYDVDANTAVLLAPVPAADISIETINRRLALISQHTDVKPIVSKRTKPKRL